MLNVFHIINGQMGHLASGRRMPCLAETVTLGAVNSGQLDTRFVFYEARRKVMKSPVILCCCDSDNAKRCTADVGEISH